MDIRERFRDREEALRQALDGRQSAIWTALPGYIVSYDPVAVTVAVQPGIKGKVAKPDGSSNYVDMPVLPDVPVCFPRGGGYTLTFPIQAGDECLVVFASRNIDAWWQSGGSQQPGDARRHDLSDGFAIVGPQSQASKISDISTTTTQLRSDDGQIHLELDSAAGGVTIKAPTGIRLDAPLVTLTGALSVENGWGAEETGTFVGTIRATEDVISDTVSGRHHVHSGVQSGPDDTDEPVP